MTRKHRTAAWFAGLALSVGAMAAECRAGTKIQVGKVWPVSQLVPMDDVDHAGWNELLANYVDARGMVDYKRWKATGPDVKKLDAYLAHLSQADLKQRATRESKLAFYINAYNAVTVKGILLEYPTSSIRNHTAKVFGYNIWHDLLLTVGTGQLSLDQIEHQVLRKMREPRIHFAIVCASIGCPPLRNEAFTADKIDAQLTDNARDFFADSAKFRADAKTRRIEMSPILDWFGEDFGQDRAAQLKSIAPYLPDAPSRQLAASGQAQVSFLDYDWGINEKKK